MSLNSKFANSIKISVFSKEEEDFDAIKDTFVSLMPFNLEEEKLSLKVSSAIGFNEKKIRIIELVLSKTRHTRAFMESLLENLSKEQKELLIRQLETRVDQHGDFFMRLDKKRLMNREFWITDSGDCYHIKVNVACFPKKKETAIDIMKKVFK